MNKIRNRSSNHSWTALINGPRRAAGLIVVLLVLAPNVAPQARSKSWLRGVWEGTGYQTDTASSWPLVLTARTCGGRRLFSVDYPSLNCGGTWQLLQLSRRRAVFREVLDRGQSECTDKGRVTIQRINNAQLIYLYSNQGSRQITASAILNRKRPAQTVAVE